LTVQYEKVLRKINSDVESAKEEQEIITKEKKVLREKLSSAIDTSVQNTTPDAKSPKLSTTPDEKKIEKVQVVRQMESNEDQAERVGRSKTKGSKKRLRTPSPSSLSTESNKKMKKTEYILSFSSFDETYKNSLMKMAKSLGATFNNTDCNSTHVVCTPKSRTVKTLAALVMSRWVVTDDWIKKSFQEGKFLPENDYGVLVKDRPFLNKKFWISTPFREDKKNARKISYLDVLLENGGAVVVPDDQRTVADYVIVPNNWNIDYSPAVTVNWNDFLRLITKEFEDKFRSETPEKEKLNKTETEIFKLTPKKDEKKSREVKEAASKMKEDKKRKIIDEKLSLSNKDTTSSSDEDTSPSNKKPPSITKRAKHRSAKH